VPIDGVTLRALQVDEVREALWQHHKLLYNAYDHYALLYTDDGHDVNAHGAHRALPPTTFSAQQCPPRGSVWAHTGPSLQLPSVLPVPTDRAALYGVHCR
jgi:hypothetical protein